MAKKKQEKHAEAQAGIRQSTEQIQALPEETVTAAPAEVPEEAEGEIRFPIVGIGASAGGLAAFEKFFANMPATTESGMAFVLVQHLDPDHKSILTDLVKRYTRMRVFEVTDGMEVQPNCAYIIPPNKDMAFMHGKLHLMDLVVPRGLRLPIDYFFRSLAQDQHERAICIVLSGTGTDGTLGLKEIKGQGGMTMVQDPGSAAYDGMPRSAIATGMVDYILLPEQMPARLIAYVDHVFGKRPSAVPLPPPEKITDSLQKIFILLRSQIGHDFTHYKRNTIHRRIERRMAVNQIDQLDSYVRYLQQNPLEVETLFRELLIGVTSFFRDPEGFETLKQQAIMPLLANYDRARPLRIWVPGCSTGEEAFSIAMLVQEAMDALKQHIKAQVFATDIDAEAIDKARTGVYPDSIAADVSPERLARFFRQENSTYHISKSIRDMVVFATQNVIEDPPFSKMDLISCRNLLIYMGPELQRKVVPLFHYALNPAGFLFLGSSETVGEFVDLFGVVDRKWKLFLRKGGPSPRPAGDFALPSLADLPAVVPIPGRIRPERELSVRELAQQTLLEQHTPPCAIINEQGEVLYIHGRTGRYLEPPPGEASLNIIRMAREGLRLELTTAIRKVIAQKTPIRYSGLQVKTNGEAAIVDLLVTPILKPASMRDLIMVVFHDVTPRPEVETVEVKPAPVTDKDQRIAELERELRTKEQYLQTTIEELETSNEELKSTNEELQSSNEELQSTNEELETSKEELQSVNEELVTVNTELQNKIEELTQANNDMNNLLAGTSVGTVFLDTHLIIQRFTPTATEVINLIQTDVGRPVGHIVSNLDYDGLVEDVQAVLDTLAPREVEVQTTDGRWYLMRILPYRTLENVIEGAVITFVDITERKWMEETLRESEMLLNKSQEMAHVGSWRLDLRKNELYWSDEVYRIFGLTPQEFGATYEAFLGAVHPDDREMIDQAYTAAVGEHKPYEIVHRVLWPDGTVRIVREESEEIVDESGQTIISIGMVHDVTERVQAEETLRESEEGYRDLYENAPNAYFSVGTDGIIRRCNRRAGELLGYAPEELVGRPVFDLYADTPQGKEKASQVLQRFRAGETIPDDDLQMQQADGTPLWISLTVNPIRDASGQVVESRSMIVDITERKRAEEALRESQARWRSITESSPDHILLLDRDATVRFVNRTIPELTVEQVPGTSIYDWVPEEFRPILKACFERVLKTGQPDRYETEYHTTDGEVLHFEANVGPVVHDGRIVSLMVCSRDVTD